MKRLIGTVAALVALIVLWPINSVEAADGKSLYQASNCAMCHGGDGKGNSMMAQMFKVDPSSTDLTKGKNETELLKVLKSGRGAMPSYGDKLNDAELRALVQYLRSLK